MPSIAGSVQWYFLCCPFCAGSLGPYDGASWNDATQGDFWFLVNVFLVELKKRKREVGEWILSFKEEKWS